MAHGILAVWTDIAAGADAADFEEWYIRQHVNERAACPGFVSGARYSAIEGSPRIFAIYETETPEVLFSPAYKASLDNPTDWTRRSLPAFEGVIRTVMRVRARAGEGRGGVVGTLRLAPTGDAEDRLAAWLAAELLDAAVAMPGIVRAEFWQAEPKSLDGDNAEKRLRKGEDRTARWVVTLDGSDEASVRRAMDELLSPAILQRRGAAPGAERGIYRLVYLKASAW
jgi:hypothetical protein